MLNTEGKRKDCSKRAISPFHTVFSTHLENFLPFSSNLNMSSANSISLEESKIHQLGKYVIIIKYHSIIQKDVIIFYRHGLTHSHTMTPFDAPGKQAF